MGHTRLGPIPKSREWQAVVEAVTESRGLREHAGGPSLPDVALVSAKTLDAAGAGLSRAKEDLGLGFTFYLLARVAVASRSNDWLGQLRTIGLEVGPASSLFDLTLELQRRIDAYLTTMGESTDVSEMAQRAAGEALAVLAREKAEDDLLSR